MHMLLHKVLACLSLASVLVACGGNGHSAAPPTDLKVQTGDTQAVLSWTAVPGVEYWVWSAPDSKMTTQNCILIKGCNILTKAVPPYTVTGLTNGTLYAFTVNARTDSGPGGPGASQVTATPRLAAQTWSGMNPVANASIRGAVAGKTTNASTGVTTGLLVAVGDNGSVLSSPDGSTWTAQSSGTSLQLRDVTYAYSKFYAVGQAGTLLSSKDGMSWSAVSLTSTQDLESIAFNGTRLVAVGKNGTLLTTLNGTDWSLVSAGIAQDLLAAVYSPAGYWIATGTASAVYKSADGLSWAPVSAATSGAWRSAAVLSQSSTINGVVSTVYRLALVSSTGETATSLDGVNWTTSATSASGGLNKVVSGAEQFVAVGSAGRVLTSLDGTQWVVRESNTTQNLYALARYSNVYYALGDQGVGIFSK